MSGPVVPSEAARNAIQQHRDQRNHNAGKQTLTEIRASHGTQDFPADVGGAADDGGNDHHAEGGHRRLINANQDGGQCAREPDPPEELAGTCPGHHARLDGFCRYPLQSQ